MSDNRRPVMMPFDGAVTSRDAVDAAYPQNLCTSSR